MIQGDIDLTENLDFYHDKKNDKNESNNIIPWINKPKRKLVDCSYFDNRLFWTDTYSNNTLTNTNNTYTSDNISYSISYDLDNLDTVSTIILHTNNMNANYVTFNNNSSLQLFNTTYNNSNFVIDYSVPVISDNREKYNSIFGKSRPKKDRSIRLHRDMLCGHKCLGDCKCNKFIMKSLNTSIFANKPTKSYEPYRKYLMKRFSREKINIDPQRDHHSYWNDYIKNDKRIPWLNKLNHRIYSDYIKDLYEEQDYSNYLTDMGWLHVQ